jgi:hypothetical protein
MMLMQNNRDLRKSVVGRLKVEKTHMPPHVTGMLQGKAINA